MVPLVYDGNTKEANALEHWWFHAFPAQSSRSLNGLVCGASSLAWARHGAHRDCLHAQAPVANGCIEYAKCRVSTII